MSDLLLHAAETIAGAIAFGFGVLIVAAGDRNQVRGLMLLLAGLLLLAKGLAA